MTTLATLQDSDKPSLDGNTELSYAHRTIAVSPSSVKQLLPAVFPDFKGRRIAVESRTSVRFYGTMWDEGYRNRYAVVSPDGRVAHVPTAPFLQRSPLHEAEHTIPLGWAVLCWSQGRCQSLTIMVHPSMMPPPMLSDSESITDDERIVLVATRNLKSSYGGVKNLRFKEAHEYTGITLERWEAAKAGLISRKLLNKAGAITNDGRNVLSAAGDDLTDLYELSRKAVMLPEED